MVLETIAICKWWLKWLIAEWIAIYLFTISSTITIDLPWPWPIQRWWFSIAMYMFTKGIQGGTSWTRPLSFSSLGVSVPASHGHLWFLDLKDLVLPHDKLWKQKRSAVKPIPNSIDWFSREKLQENPMIFMGKSMVSCRFSLKSTHWVWGSAFVEPIQLLSVRSLQGLMAMAHILGTSQ